MEPVSSAANRGPILQLKVRLLGISPMVWRRILVPESASLSELHGIVQVAMGWTGIHLFEFTIRGVRYTGPDLCGAPVEFALLDCRFRRNARLRYVYDMLCCWEHELRVEECLPAVAGKRYPRCTGGAGACPPEDCGGPDGYHARRDEAMGVEAMDDLVLLADFVERVVVRHDCSWADDDETRWRVEMAAQRSASRARFLEEKFSRGAVNRCFRSGGHRRLMTLPESTPHSQDGVSAPETALLTCGDEGLLEGIWSQVGRVETGRQQGFDLGE